MTQKTSIQKYKSGTLLGVFNDKLAIESPLQISILQHGVQRQVSITMRTPGNDKELALGFLLTEGILSADLSPSDWPIRHLDAKKNHILLELPDSIPLDWDRLARQTYTSSSCGVCGKTSIEHVYTKVPWQESGDNFKVKATLITQLPDRLRAAQTLFQLTGGIHACGLFDGRGSLEAIFEDVGRHNAFDKLSGKLWMSKKLPCNSFILVLSGRASFELIQKAAMAGIPCVIAVGAPSSLAVELADELGITLCGFTKKQTFNCYTGFHRILTS